MFYNNRFRFLVFLYFHYRLRSDNKLHSLKKYSVSLLSVWNISNSFFYLKVVFNIFSVESSPKTARKCADDLIYDNNPNCHDVIFGQMSMLACYCSEDFCNSATFQRNTLTTIFIATLSILIFAHWICMPQNKNEKCGK